MSAQQTQPMPASLSAREVLADAIFRHKAAVESVRHVGAALENADETVYRAKDRLKEAEANRAEAKANEGSRLAAAALGEATDSVSAADAELVMAQTGNDLTIARRTREALQDRADRQAAEVEKAKRALDDAVAAVIKAETPVLELLDRGRRLQDDLISTRLALRWLCAKNCVGESDFAAVRDFLWNTALPVGAGGFESSGWDGAHPVNDAWNAAVEQLKVDPATPLPSSG